jgi:hypothetical protein
MARSRRKKTTTDRLIDAALYAAPAPVRTIASNPIGFRFLLIAGAALMATGIMTLDWQDGTPHFRFHRDKATQVKQDLVNDLGQKVQGWNLPSMPGNANPPGYFTQSPTTQGYSGNQGQPNGYYYPQGANQPNAYPSGAYPAQGYPQWPTQQTPYPQAGSGYPGDYRR